MKLHRSRIIVAALLGIGICASGTWGTTLRVVSYNIDCEDEGSDNNITGATHSLPTVVQAIGLHHIGSNAQSVDVMSCEELNSTTLSNFVTQLNVIYGAATYAFDPTPDPNTGGGPDGLIYRTNTVQVVSARALRTGQTVLLQSNGTYVAAHSPGGGVNGVTRAPMVYRLQPVGSGTNNDFYFYVSHARSTSDDSVGDARYAEAQEVRSDAKYNLPAGAHILYGGDWNLFNGSGENAYKCLTGQTTSDGINWSDTSAIWANTNQTQGYDPTSKTAPPTTTTWANVAGDNALYLYDDATYKLTSRIDIQLPNALMFGVYNSQGGVQLAPDTSDPFDISNFPSSKYPYAFEVFGNNGTTPENGVSTNPNNHSLDDLANTVPNATTVYNDLDELGSGSNFTGSDHYPIVGDYNVVVVPTAPTANFSGTPTNGTAPLTVTFTDTSSNSPTSWSWTFGDTGTSTSQNPSHTYTTPGTYTVTLIASNSGGSGTNTQNDLITVLTLPSVAGFTASPTNGPAPLSVNFTDASTGSVTGWAWAFGDGNTSTSQNPSDIYTNPGTYTVQEIVTGNGGSGTNTQTALIGVYSPFAWWQFSYFGCTNCAQAQAGADPYGKGISNTNQFLLGLNPTNPASVFQIDSLATQGSNGTDVLVTWTTVGGITNVVQATAGATDGSNSYATNFIDLSPLMIIQGAGGQITNYLDASGATNSPARYYRIRFQQ
jgi:PKD repeat protein